MFYNLMLYVNIGIYIKQKNFFILNEYDDNK